MRSISVPRAVSITIGTSESAPQLAADVAAVTVGKAEVEHHQVRLHLPGELQRAGGGAGHDRLESRPSQRLRKGLGDRVLILDDEDPPGRRRLDRHRPTVTPPSRAICQASRGFAVSLPVPWGALQGPLPRLRDANSGQEVDDVKSLKTRVAASRERSSASAASPASR